MLGPSIGQDREAVNKTTVRYRLVVQMMTHVPQFVLIVARCSVVAWTSWLDIAVRPQMAAPSKLSKKRHCVQTLSQMSYSSTSSALLSRNVDRR